MIKIPKLQQGDLVELTWLDHWTDLGWQRSDTAMTRKPSHTTSVGYYIGHTAEYICIGATYDPENKHYNSVQYRLLPDIIKIRKVS